MNDNDGLSWFDALQKLNAHFEREENDNLKNAFRVFCAGFGAGVMASPPGGAVGVSAEWLNDAHQIFETLGRREATAANLVRVLWRNARTTEVLAQIVEDVFGLETTAEGVVIKKRYENELEII